MKQGAYVNQDSDYPSCYAVFRCPKWACHMLRWEDEPETQAMMGGVTPKSNATAAQANYPSLPKPLPYDPSQPVMDPPPPPLPQPGEKSSSKRPADEIEEDGEQTDPDEVDGVTSDSSKYSDSLWETSDEDTVTAKAGSSRKERRTTTKDTPSKGRVSFASASTSFISGSTPFATAPTTPGTGHRSRLAFDLDEDDIFTTRPLQQPPANSLISRLVAAGVNPDCRAAFTPETPHRHSSQFPFQLPSPNTPGAFRRALAIGPIGLQTPSVLTQDVFSFQNELGRISTDLETRLMELMGRQALQAEGFKRGRDISRKLLKDSKETIITLVKRNEELEERIKQLEAEKESTRQVNENLKSQLDSMRLTSPSEVSSPGQ